MNLLKLSQKWMVTQGTEYALFYIDELDLHPTRLLELSRMYSIDKWVRPAIQRLMRMDLSSLSEEHVNRVGFKVYTILAKPKERMEYAPKLVSAYPPPINMVESWECKHTYKTGCLVEDGNQADFASDESPFLSKCGRLCSGYGAPGNDRKLQARGSGDAED